LRIFGKANILPPTQVEYFTILRGHSEPRNAWLKWNRKDDATAYLIRFGLEPDKLYGSIMVFGENEYYFTGMDRNKTYYFTIQAFNEGGCGPQSQTVESSP